MRISSLFDQCTVQYTYYTQSSTFGKQVLGMAQAVVRSMERHLDYEEEEVGPGLVGSVLEFLPGGGGREGGGAVLAVQTPLLVVSVVQETVWCQTPHLSSLVPAFISEIKQCLTHRSSF